jgi:hypothetical protein
MGFPLRPLAQSGCIYPFSNSELTVRAGNFLPVQHKNLFPSFSAFVGLLTNEKNENLLVTTPTRARMANTLGLHK